MPLIEEKKKPDPESLVRGSRPNIFSLISKVQVKRPRNIKINWKPLKRELRKFLKEMWNDS